METRGVLSTALPLLIANVLQEIGIVVHDIVVPVAVVIAVIAIVAVIAITVSVVIVRLLALIALYNC